MAIRDDDDFILTISSDDEVEDQSQRIASKQQKITTTQNRKRKSNFPEPNGKHLKSRLIALDSGVDSELPARNRSKIEEEELDRDSEDSAIDPEFEFGIGLDSFEIEDMQENWNSKNGATSVGVDAIIDRRRLKQNGTAKAQPSQESSSEEDKDGFTGFDDNDESLADDGFGTGRVPDGLQMENEADEIEDEEHQSESEDSDQITRIARTAQGTGDDEDQDEDEDEFAAPMPHPDDLSEDEGTDDEMRKRQAAFFEPEVPNTNANISNHGTPIFQNMSLSRPILKGISAAGFSSPTAIQEKAIPVALLGKDVVGGAVTGSGKTAAFIIPILERLLYRPKKVPTTRVAILMPTRELAVQCHTVGTKLASFTDISFALLVGGLSLRDQEQTLRKRPDIVIATPGRFIDHMRNSASFAVENIEILVLDEADRMLEDGFADELNEVLTTIPKSRQTMLFSATMTENVDQLIRAGLQRPVRLMVDQKRQTVQGLTQEFIKMKGGKRGADDERRLAYLLQLCTSVYTAKTIVFLPRKSLAHRIKVLFALQGIQAAELHGSMSQEQRLNAISSFRDGQATHLLATDLASRGLDIPRVETVLNFTVPSTTTTYLHRVGRTARAGQNGVSCTLFAPSSAEKKSKATSERGLLRPVIRLARNQGANIRTRTMPQEVIDNLETKISSLQDEIDSILKEEKEERLLQQTERDITKGENLVKYQDEIASRPKRTWFQTENEKKMASKLGKRERLGISDSSMSKDKPKREKRKLSGKEKKRLQDRDSRVEGPNKSWKKSKNPRSKRH